MNYRCSSFLIEALLVGPDTCWIIECQCKYFRSGPRTPRKDTVFPSFSALFKQSGQPLEGKFRIKLIYMVH